MPDIEIISSPGDDNVVDDRIMSYAKLVLCSDDPSQVTGLIKEKNSVKRSRHVFRLDLDDISYFFKLYSNHSCLKGVQDLFRGQRAKRAFDISDRLTNLGLETARPLAAFEIKGMSCKKRSVFVTECMKGVPLKQLFTGDFNQSLQQSAFEALSGIYRRLLENNIYHYDLNLANCWLYNDRIILLDVDDVRQLRRLGLIRLYLNIEKHNRILMRHIKRFPNSWFKDQHRRNLIRELVSKFVRPGLVNVFLKRVDRVSARHVAKSTASTKSGK